MDSLCPSQCGQTVQPNFEKHLMPVVSGQYSHGRLCGASAKKFSRMLATWPVSASLGQLPYVIANELTGVAFPENQILKHKLSY